MSGGFNLALLHVLSGTVCRLKVSVSGVNSVVKATNGAICQVGAATSHAHEEAKSSKEEAESSTAIQDASRDLNGQEVQLEVHWGLPVQDDSTSKVAYSTPAMQMVIVGEMGK